MYQPMTFIKINENEAEVTARLLYPGEFTSGISNKTFPVNENDIIQIKEKYNSRVKRLFNQVKSNPIHNEELIEIAPIQFDHDLNPERITGKVVGKLWTEEYNGSIALYSRLRIVGKSSVDRVERGLYKNVSINFNTKTHFLNEVSIVTYGAVDDALMLSKANGDDNIAFIEARNSLSHFQGLIKSNNEEIRSLREESTRIKDVAKFSRKLQGLVRDGHLTLAMKKSILRDMDIVDNESARQAVSAMFSKMPRVIHDRPSSRSDNLVEELLMTDKNSQRAEILKKFNARVLSKTGKGNAQFSSGIEGKINKEQSHIKAEHEVIIARSSGNELKRLLSLGDIEGAKNVANAMFKKEGEKEEEKIELAADKESKKKDEEAEKLEKEAKKKEDENAEYTRQLEAAFVKLSKFLDKDGE
jgi:hypothetical protein